VSARRQCYILNLALTRPLALSLLAASLAASPADVLTANYDNNRTSADLSEHILTTTDVNPGQFGKLYALPVDGQVYAQPLYVHGLNLPGNLTRNVLYVATMHNSVYAFDADAGAATPPLWQVNLGPAVDPASVAGAAYTDILHEIGILGTPVIDRASSTIYVVNETITAGNPAFFLHALDLATGREKLDGPVEIQASVTGAGWVNGETLNGQLPFRPQDHIQRPGLLLANGMVYVAFGSHGDGVPWHGWIMAYQAGDVQQLTAVFCTTPSAAGSAIWQGGRGLAADSSGNLYVSTGNGSYDGIDSWGESVLHLTPLLTVADWVTPADFDTWTADDTDFGSNGPILIPGSNLLIAGGKAGLVVVTDRTNLGHELDDNPSGVQLFQAASTGMFEIFNAALWNRPDGSIFYIWAPHDFLRAFQMQNGAFNPTPIALSAAQGGLPFHGMTVSSNAFFPLTGILWATSGTGSGSSMPGTLYAFDALDVSRELWDSDMSGARDTLGNFSKFANPTVADGKVYVPTDSQQITVYGLLPVPGVLAAVNAASYLSSPVAPGELVTLFGNRIGPATPMGLVLDSQGRVATSLGGVQVTFDGAPAPLLYVSASQINAVAPFAIAGHSSTQIQVALGGASYSITAAVSPAAPAIFAADSTGAGQGAILNSDLSVNSPANPARRGTSVAIYATGTGALQPPLPDGAVIPPINPPMAATPVSVTIGGAPAAVTYQGGAPGFVAGVMQINAQVPDAVTPGPAVPVVLSVGSTEALNTITLAVQ
jgi:uncharacterized protein (TIGR03437 family)